MPIKKGSKTYPSHRIGSRWWFKRNTKKIIIILALIAAVVSLPVTLWMVQQSQDNRGGAAFCSGAYNCSARCNDGHVTTDICPAYGAYGSCTQWAADACATRAGVKEMLSDGGTGQSYNDGSGSSSGSGTYTCPNNAVTAVYCRNQPEGFEVKGTCTCRKTSQGCGCFTGTSSGGGSTNRTGSNGVNASRCDNKSNPHEYCKSTFGDNNYCGLSGNKGSQYQCMPSRGRLSVCGISEGKNGYPHGGQTTSVCSSGNKCEMGVCIPERAAGTCPGGKIHECPDPLAQFCNGNKLCVPRRSSGSSCANNDQCLSRMCKSGTCFEPQCTNSSQCNPGLFCNATDSRFPEYGDTGPDIRGECAIKSIGGEGCWIGDQCIDGYACRNFVCKPV